MLTIEERDQARKSASAIIDRTLYSDLTDRLISVALLESVDREAAYQARIAELQDAIERTAASGLENAKRFTAELEAERLARFDPLFGELTTLETIRVDDEVDDDKQCPSEWLGLASEEIDRADSMIGMDIIGADAIYRDSLMHAAMFCLAGVRCVDRARKRPT